MSGSSRPSPKTLLVVEDFSDDFELLQRMLRKSRILNPVQHVCAIADGMAYLKGEGEYADREKYPFPILVLLDMRLSDGVGYDLLRWLKNNPECAPAAVVVLTGSDFNAVRQAYSEGASSFLNKPLRFEDFENMANAVHGIKLTKTEDGYVLESDKESPQ